MTAALKTFCKLQAIFEGKQVSVDLKYPANHDITAYSRMQTFTYVIAEFKDSQGHQHEYPFCAVVQKADGGFDAHGLVQPPFFEGPVLRMHGSPYLQYERDDTGKCKVSRDAGKGNPIPYKVVSSLHMGVAEFHTPPFSSGRRECKTVLNAQASLTHRTGTFVFIGPEDPLADPEYRPTEPKKPHQPKRPRRLFKEDTNWTLVLGISIPVGVVVVILVAWLLWICLKKPSPSLQAANAGPVTRSTPPVGDSGKEARPDARKAGASPDAGEPEEAEVRASPDTVEAEGASPDAREGAIPDAGEGAMPEAGEAVAFPDAGEAQI